MRIPREISQVHGVLIQLLNIRSHVYQAKTKSFKVVFKRLEASYSTEGTWTNRTMSELEFVSQQLSHVLEDRLSIFCSEQKSKTYLELDKLENVLCVISLQFKKGKGTRSGVNEEVDILEEIIQRARKLRAEVNLINTDPAMTPSRLRDSQALKTQIDRVADLVESSKAAGRATFVQSELLELKATLEKVEDRFGPCLHPRLEESEG